MELYELHILYRSLCSINHCNTIASSYLRIRCHCVDCPHSTCSHEGHLTQEGIYLFRFRIEDIRTITFYIWGSACHLYTQVVLRDNLNSIVIFEDCNIWVSSHRIHQSTLYLKACIISMMKNTKVTVPSFTMSVVCTVCMLIKIYTPVNQRLDSFWRITYTLSYS